MMSQHSSHCQAPGVHPPEGPLIKSQILQPPLGTDSLSLTVASHEGFSTPATVRHSW